jgi:hypothetical protein
MQSQVTTSQPSRSLVKAILITGLIAGTLDIITATLVSQSNPIRLLQFIASAAVGREDAFTGGIPMALLGLLFHYIIAYSWTILFFLLYPKISFLQKNKYVVGIVYGVVVWLVMNLFVLPMSLIVQREFNWIGAIRGAVILMFMIGLPISLMTNRFYRGREN